MLLPIFKDIFRHRRVNACHIGKQCRACRIQIHPDAVYAILHHAAECLTETLLVHIMLILSDAYRLRIDLHKFGQWILKSSRDGRRASLTYIKLRKFLTCKLTCRVDRSSRFIDDHIPNLLRYLFQKFHDKLF